MKRILLTCLALGLLCGVASADRRRGGWNRHNTSRARGGVVVHSTPVRAHHQPRHVYVERTRVVRRPIYVQRPIIRYRYYNYYQRPAIIVENYPAQPGYYWVAGQWQWSGYEWIWQPGHYEPDASYVQPGYNYDYNYNGNGTSTSTSVSVGVGGGYSYSYGSY
jgi:hypothetical protein